MVHIVVADAVALAYPQPIYKPFLVTVSDFGPVTSPAMFVGGAAAAILEHVYSTSLHKYFINTKRREFIDRYGRRHLDSWKKGLRFGRKNVFRDRWNWPEIERLIKPVFSNYTPGPQQHAEDPTAPGQGFYGHSWGLQPSAFALPADLITKSVEANGCAPRDPPRVGSADYERSLEDVRRKGMLRGDPKDTDSVRRSAQQDNPGLFWAYDGARDIGTPPRLYNQVIVAVARKDGLGPRRLARLLALCNVAMSDAGNVSWHSKYKHKFWRPVLGLNPNLPKEPKQEDIKWLPLGSPKTNRADFAAGSDTKQFLAAANQGGTFVAAQSFLGATADINRSPFPKYTDAAFTPNFPAYPSGHATFGAACFEMLRLFRRDEGLAANPDKIRLEDFVSDELNGESVDNFRPVERRIVSEDFATVQKLIDDNATSRVWLGVHWDFDSSGGVESGTRVAEEVRDRVYGKL